MKAKKRIVKQPVAKPSTTDLKLMRDALKREIDKAQEAYNIAENHLEAAQAELDCRQEFFDDADNDLFEAENDLYDFECVVEDAKASGDWKEVVRFKPSR
jgi:predicted  nucleic acid-binding Zn-ribbon protein